MKEKTNKKFGFKRYPIAFLAIFLATVLSLFAIQAVADGNVITNGITGLTVTYDSSCAISNQTDTGFDVVVNGYNDNTCNAQSRTGNLTFTNGTDADIAIAFDYTLTQTNGSSGGGKIGDTAMKNSDSVKYLLIPANGNVAMTITSPKGEDTSVKVAFTDLNTASAYAGYVPTADDDETALAAKVVKFNGYDWYLIEDNSTSETEGTVTLFAKDTIGSSRFDNSKNVYSESMVKSYLDNLTAEGGAFADVADAIVSTDLEDVTVTGAKLWLLSKDEVNTTYKLSTALNKCSVDWWLRTPAGSSYIVFVNGESGSVDNNGIFYMTTYGVRPALNLDLSKVTFDSETKTFALPAKDPVPYMAWDETSKTVKDVEGGCTDYTVVTDSTAAFEDGKWYVVNGEVSVASRITVTGTVNLILCDGAKLTANEGIALTSGKTLNIYGQSNGTGELTARGGEKIAGIGGGNKEHAGNVTIHGGVVYATGGTNGAGIGGGNEGNGSNVTINGGKVYATGGTNGAGIGGGDYANGGIVTINGGTVDAKTIGNTSATSIGNGRYKSNAGSLIVASTHVAYSSNSPITDANKTSATAVQGSGAAMNIARQHYMLVEEGNLHTHSFTYSADGATMTATCSAEGCNLTDNKVSFTIIAENATYDSNTHGATVDFTAWEAAGLPALAVQYTGRGTTTYDSTTAPTNVGTYKASITLGKGDAANIASVEYTIAKADPAYTAPTDLTATYGDTLSTVTLPDGWAWADDTQSVGAPGTNTFKATFTPEDTDNYNVLEDLDVDVEVADRMITVTLDANGGTTGALWIDSFEIGASVFEVGSLLNPPAAMITAPEDYEFDGLEVNGVKVAVGETPEIPEGTETISVKFLWKATKVGWVEEENGWRYYEDGGFVTGWKKLDRGQWYYFDENGIAAKGWKKIDGEWYFFRICAMQTGWIKTDNKWYYLNSNGTMATGWVHYKDSWYYLKNDGSMATGWVKDGGKWYYLNSSGAMQTGWVKDGGKWYYLESSGAMRTADLTYKGKVYKFNNSGVCLNP